MADQPFERDLRAWLAEDLDAVRGPHSRWADAPVARRVAASRAAPPRWRTVALLAAAVVGVLALAVAVAVMPREVPVASAPPSLEPWPSSIGPSATPTAGEIPLGRVAVVTAFGHPALLVRVSPAADVGGPPGTVYVTIGMRVVGPLDLAVGSDRFLVVRGSRTEPLDFADNPVDPLAIRVDAPVGTEVSGTFGVPVAAGGYVALAYHSPGGSVAFSYPLQAATPPPSLQGRCPTLEDYAVASLQPSASPVPPSFAPVAPDATPSTGLLAIGETGILPALDGSPGALVRVSNVRLCDRLPNHRADWSGSPAVLLLADVEIESLRPGTLPEGFIPGAGVVVASYGGWSHLSPAIVFDMPGANSTTTLDTGPGFAYRGTIAWEVPDDDVRITIDAQRAEKDASGRHVVQLSYVARAGASYSPQQRTPEPRTDPAASPTSGVAPLGEPVVLAADGGTMPLVVDGIDQVTRYTGVVPAPPAEAFLEARLTFGRGSGTFRLEPVEWVILGADGVECPQLRQPENGQLPAGWPNVLSASVESVIPPDWPGMPAFMVAEVPAPGRITLEYRPDGGPALVTWVLRGE